MTDQTNPAGLLLLNTLQGHDNTIVRIAWVAGGQELSSASVDNTVRLWKPDEADSHCDLKGLGKGFTDLAISPNGAFAITTSWYDHKAEVWQLETESRYWHLMGHSGPVNAVAVTPQHIITASDDETIMVWSWRDGSLLKTLRGHEHFVWGLATSPDYRYLISGSADATIKIWDLETAEDVVTLIGHSKWVTAVALNCDGSMLASGSDDGTIRLWDWSSGELRGVLTGHTAAINVLDFSCDGLLMASKSMDGTVRLWRCDTWETVAVLDEPVYRGRGIYPRGLAFHPTRPILATLGDRDTVIRIWKLDYSVLLAKQSPTTTYTTARIALVGDVGVGKSALGFRLSNNNTLDTYATTHQHTWVLKDLSHTRDDGTVCHAILWDFMSEPSSQTIQNLFIRHVDIALLLVDPTRWDDPLKNVEYWRRRFGKDTRLVLVGTRTDMDVPMMSTNEFEDFCKAHGIDGGYVATSAVSGKGIDELGKVLQDLLDWNNNLCTVNLAMFQKATEYIQYLRSSMDYSRTLLPLEELRQYLVADGDELDLNQLQTLVSHLENQGYIFLLHDAHQQPYVLLMPDLLVDLTIELMGMARRNPRGLGTLDESRLLNAGGYRFTTLDVLDPFEQGILLEGAMNVLYQQGMYIQETYEAQRLLIFPTLLNQKPPLVETGHTEEDKCYRVRGDVEHLYAMLVVLLNHTGLFTRAYHWNDRAQFEMGLGEVCGFEKIEISENELELVLYYGLGVQTFTRSIFGGLFEKFLYGRQVQVEKFPAVTCPNCDHRQSRQTIVDLMSEGHGLMFCAWCGNGIDLRLLHTPTPDVAEPPPIAPAERSRTQAHFQDALDKIRQFFIRDHRVGTTCFISYAWGNANHEQWVARLAHHLRTAGIDVAFDHWDKSNIGKSAEPFLRRIETSDFVVVVGTPMYRQKHESRQSSTGSMVHDEIELINQRLNGTEETKSTVLPLLLEGDAKQSFPPLLHERVYSDFQQERFYFVSLFNLILTLYKVPSQDPVIGELRKFMGEGAGRASANGKNGHSLDGLF